MDLFKQSLAPIPTKGWDEINDRATEVIQSQLSARSVLFVDGPHGLEKNSVAQGRLKLLKDAKKGEQDAEEEGLEDSVPASRVTGVTV
jgi:uncharacterized linocin/CFP29 family protein